MSDSIFAKYRNYPGYPFDDWTEEPDSFYSLMTFWSEVFRADVSDADENFVPMMELRQLMDEPVFAVVSRDGRRGFRVVHLPPQLAQTHAGFFLTRRYGPDSIEIPDSFTLDIATDLMEGRIHAIRTVLREQLNGSPRSLLARNQALDDAIERYSDLFPSMIVTTRAYLSRNIEPIGE